MTAPKRLHDYMTEQTIRAAEVNIADPTNKSTAAEALREAFAYDLAAQGEEELSESLADVFDATIAERRKSAEGLSPFHATTGRAPRN